jgi:hypothetical protein
MYVHMVALVEFAEPSLISSELCSFLIFVDDTQAYLCCPGNFLATSGNLWRRKVCMEIRVGVNVIGVSFHFSFECSITSIVIYGADS